MNSIWLVITAMAAFITAYRLYGAFLATKVVMLSDANQTPAYRLRDGVDYHPTKGLVLFGHHFAAIAGPGPLIGPVLASQWGYFPGFTWIIVGACLAGGVHDFVVLTASVRQDGLSLPYIARKTLGPTVGITTAVATLFIVISILASVAMVVVNALGHSPWGMFTIITTIPAALLTGLWMYKIRPGDVRGASILGVAIILLGVYFGKDFADSAFGHYLLFETSTLSVILPGYAMIASILPVWVLMCPRDYLSSYLKIGVIFVLAIGIFLAQPALKMPATTQFINGGGPVVSGPVWPFVCIVIMCGALSGFHALIASGTTPKMISKESEIKPIGYGAMLLEGFVAVMALIAACSLEPGDYFAINVSQASPPEVARYEKLLKTSAESHGLDLEPKNLHELEASVDEKLAGRVGGAVTLAVGMAKVFSDVIGKHLMAYWYHFVIMFEALFILTLLETGTRVARFVFQETLAQINPNWTLGGKPRWGLNVAMSVVVCFLWGGLLYIGNLGTLWKMLGISNQLLAVIALAVGTTYLLQHAKKRAYALCTGIPFVFAVVTVFFAGIESVRGWWNSVPVDWTERILARLACVLAVIMLGLTAVIVLRAVHRWQEILYKKNDE